jgi:hypothetical protein
VQLLSPAAVERLHGHTTEAMRLRLAAEPKGRRGSGGERAGVRPHNHRGRSAWLGAQRGEGVGVGATHETSVITEPPHRAGACTFNG